MPETKGAGAARAARAELPPVGQFDAALRKTTEFLAGELYAPSAEAPAWSELEWRVAMAVAVMHGISGLLADRLAWSGPPLWRSFLLEQLHQGRLRQQRIEMLLRELDRAAAAAGVALVALKGSALLDLGYYGAGERPMGDIDLLVRDEDFAAAAAVLGTLGYVAELATWRHQTFMPAIVPGTVQFGEHVSNPIKIELHTRIMERLPMRDCEITAQQFPRAARAGLNPYPSQAALMRHLLLHAAGNIRTRSLRCIQLLDLALLSARMDDADWAQLLAEQADAGELWWALPPLLLAERYFPGSFPGSLPGSLGERMHKACPHLLRRMARRHRLADVSLSSIRIQAFPGLEWSRTPHEALQLIFSRAFPDRETRSQLRHHAATLPALAGSAWYQLSYPRRVLRWLVSQPPRAQTLYSLRRALEYHA